MPPVTERGFRPGWMFFPLLMLLWASGGFVDGKSLEEWRARSVYQVVTDRFARFEGWGGCDLSKYCGGNFRGITANLAYIQRLGFDAIWISPVVENTPDGYHGYWAQNLYEINSHFGSREDLKTLVREAHSRGIWVMVDVVANHMGYIPYNDVNRMWPFNRWEHYHDCGGCDQWCNINNFNNEWMVEHCRLAGLPDLNQDHPWVRGQLLHWINYLVNEYDFDGIRIDTVPEVKKEFWDEFTNSAGVFSIGENFDGRIDHIAKYQGYAIDSMLDYPMYYTLRDVFQRRGAMTLIPWRRGEQKDYFDDMRVLGVFVDNHDNPRFLADQRDESLYKNALAYVLLGEGIPFVYYGTEQGFAGGADPQNREPLWNSGFRKNSDLFEFISILNRLRKSKQIWRHEHEEVHAENECYVFLRGDVMVALTNVGSGRWQNSCRFNLGGHRAYGSSFSIVYPRGASIHQFPNGAVDLMFSQGMPLILKKYGWRKLKNPFPENSIQIPFTEEMTKIPYPENSIQNPLNESLIL